MPKRVLITGGAGFIGHHLIEHLLKNTDWEIVSLDRLNVSGNYNRLTDIESWLPEKHRFTPVAHDLRCAINELVAAQIGAVDIILHLSASSHVDRSILDPMGFVLDNVVGTTNLLEFAREVQPLDAFIYFSTDEVFGPAADGVAYREWDRYRSGNPYAATKAGAEEMCLAFANTYGLPIIITHTMNVFGERQHPEKFIPLCVKGILADKAITIHANQSRTQAGSRMWIHARNVAASILFLLRAKERGLKITGDKFNIVGEKEVDNLEMAQRIAGVMGRELRYEMVDFHSSRPGHDLRYALDGSKMSAMNWELPISFESSLTKTIQWMLESRHRHWLGKGHGVERFKESGARRDDREVLEH